jgi:hypothetical protein
MLAGIMEMFTYLKVGLSFVLGFVGIKMILVDIYKIPITVSLGIIGGLLALSILASLILKPREAHAVNQPFFKKAAVKDRNHFAPSVTPVLISLLIVLAILALVKWTG